VRTRLALIAAVAVTAVFPAAALADDEPAPAPAEQQADAPPAESQPEAPSCLPSEGQAADSRSIRGVHVGGRAVIRDADGNPLNVSSVSYCVDGGGIFGFALSNESDVVLALSTAEGDSIGPINPTSPAESARTEFPKMKKIARSGKTAVYRVDSRRQLLLGVADGRVNFVAAADRLLLEYPNKLGYYLRRLGF
jgi:hypothetical protein